MGVFQVTEDRDGSDVRPAAAQLTDGSDEYEFRGRRSFPSHSTGTRSGVDAGLADERDV